jgi:hypothetical protein
MKATEIALSDRDPQGKVRQEIVLKTEPEENISGFIVGNSLCRSCGGLRLWGGIGVETATKLLDAFAPLEPCTCEVSGQIPVVRADSKTNVDLIICGAGPSLRTAVPRLKRHKGDVWGCNSALNWLVEHNRKATHGVAIDPSTRMWMDDADGRPGVWIDPPDVGYLIATTTNPGLATHLLAHDRNVEMFHSMRGSEYEMALYPVLYPDTALAIYGLNVTNRAIDLAVYMGYRHIAMAGCDCALGSDRTMYADGRKLLDEDVRLQGKIDGRMWYTKPDMLMSGVELVRRQRSLGPTRLEFIGDTLPRALQKKPDEFLTRCIDWAANT